MSISCSLGRLSVQSTAKYDRRGRAPLHVSRIAYTLCCRRRADGGHLGHSNGLAIGVEVCRSTLDQGRNGLVCIWWKAGGGGSGLWAVIAVVGGASVGRGTQLGDVGEAGEARDAVGSFGVEAALGSMLMMAAMGSGWESVTAVAVLDGGSGEGGEGGGCRGRSATRGTMVVRWV